MIIQLKAFSSSIKRSQTAAVQHGEDEKRGLVSSYEALTYQLFGNLILYIHTFQYFQVLFISPSIQYV